MSDWPNIALEHLLCCPLDQRSLSKQSHALVCPLGHTYPIISGVPVMRIDDGVGAIPQAARTQVVDVSWHPRFNRNPLFLELLYFNEAINQTIRDETTAGVAIDSVVSHLIGRTGGYLYLDKIGRLPRYPIPPFPPSAAGFELCLDIGCGWGRWSFAASHAGKRVIGLDWSFAAIMAARRVAEQQGLDVEFVCGDARALPFAAHTFDRVFSYSVLQHLSKPDATAAVSHIGRVLRDGGQSLIEMANAKGLRSRYHLHRRGYTEGEDRDVRYWLPAELRQTFEDRIGPTTLQPDAFGGLNIQPSDAPIHSFAGRVAVSLSETMKRLAARLPALAKYADSLWVSSTKQCPGAPRPLVPTPGPSPAPTTL